MCFSGKFCSFNDDCFSDLEEHVLLMRVEKLGVLCMVNLAWIPKVEIPDLHPSTDLYLPCPIFEHDLQRYRTFPTCPSASVVCSREIDKRL